MCILAGFGVADYKAWKTILVQMNTQGIVVSIRLVILTLSFLTFLSGLILS